MSLTILQMIDERRAKTGKDVDSELRAVPFDTAHFKLPQLKLKFCFCVFRYQPFFFFPLENLENSELASPWSVFQQAMDLNLMELELQNRQFEMEQQELEQAIAMSLFVEQERARLAMEVPYPSNPSLGALPPPPPPLFPRVGCVLADGKNARRKQKKKEKERGE